MRHLLHRIVSVIANIPDETAILDCLCYFGYATGLMPAVSSFLVGGDDCDVANGCCTHIHAGFSCAADEQMGHWYDSEMLESDPWQFLGYETTDMEGSALYGSCTETGFASADALNRAFIV